MRWENPTVRYWSAVTDVSELQIYLAKVQSWFVRVTECSYFMVITVHEFDFRIVIKEKSQKW